MAAVTDAPREVQDKGQTSVRDGTRTPAPVLVHTEKAHAQEVPSPEGSSGSQTQEDPVCEGTGPVGSDGGFFRTSHICCTAKRLFA